MATAALVATEPPALIPMRAVPRSAVDQPAAPSLVGDRPINDVAMTLTLNADGTASLAAPAIDQGAAS